MSIQPQYLFQKSSLKQSRLEEKTVYHKSCDQYLVTTQIAVESVKSITRMKTSLLKQIKYSAIVAQEVSVYLHRISWYLKCTEEKKSFNNLKKN